MFILRENGFDSLKSGGTKEVLIPSVFSVIYKQLSSASKVGDKASWDFALPMMIYQAVFHILLLHSKHPGQSHLFLYYFLKWSFHNYLSLNTRDKVSFLILLSKKIFPYTTRLYKTPAAKTSFHILLSSWIVFICYLSTENTRSESATMRQKPCFHQQSVKWRIEMEPTKFSDFHDYAHKIY